MTDYVLAVDGGGTKTHVARAARDGTITMLAKGAGVNPMDNPDWRTEFELCMEEASDRFDDIDYGILGLPGYGEIDTYTTLQEEAVHELCPFPYEIMNDVEIAFEGAFLDQPGILILAGTGSMAIGRSADGGHAEVGGWGEGFGDEGSGYWIGREAITRVSWVLDGRLDAHAFAETMLETIGIPSTPGSFELMDWYYNLSHQRVKVAALAQTVDALAREGDTNANEILAAAAAHLSHHIDTARQHIGADESLPWSYAGSVFNSRILKETLGSLQRVDPVAPVLPPVGGGLWVAARQAEWTISDDWVKRVAQGLPTFERS